MPSSSALDPVAFDTLEPAQTLTLLEEAVTRRRRVEVEDLLLCLRWADLNSTDPRDDPRPHPELPLPPGSDRLVHLGGEGTPMVRQLELCELGVARRVHTASARKTLADALDLRHRLPRTYAKVLSLDAEPWLAGKVASMSRDLPVAVVGIVDRAVARAITGQAPSRVLEIAAAKIIEADPETHAQHVADARHRRFVGLGRLDATGLRHVIARITAGDAAWIDAMVNRVADILANDPDHPGCHDLPRDEVRAIAFGWLARPAELLVLLLEHTNDSAGPVGDEPGDPADRGPDHCDEDLGDDFPGDFLDKLVGGYESASDSDFPDSDIPEDLACPDFPGGPGVVPDSAGDGDVRDLPTTDTGPDTAPSGPCRAFAFPADLLQALRDHDPAKLRPPVTLYVHLHQAALGATPGATPGQAAVARVEGLGPHGLGQVIDLLRHSHVTLKPVLDLAERLTTHAYEHPETIRERLHLLHGGDMFPHATLQSRRITHDPDLDLDHLIPYAHPPRPPGGTKPPGQTGVFTSQPLNRTGHRAKTHLGYTLTPLPTGAIHWRTPHGLTRIVDHTGTHLPDRDHETPGSEG